jgi:hypothetical protein
VTTGSAQVTTTKPRPAAGPGRPATGRAPGPVARLLIRLDQVCGERGDRWVFNTSLALIAAGILLGLVLPLAPDFIPMHDLPTNHDPHIEGKDEGQVTLFWLLSVSGFALAVWRWRRGQRPSTRTLVLGALLLTALALLVPPVASEDVYAYSFYGTAQYVYHDNPYLSFPDQHTLHEWYPLWSWRGTGPVYGPPFSLFLYGVAVLAGPSLLAWVIWMKLLMTAFAAAGVWLLVRALAVRPAADARWNGRAGAPARRLDRGWPILLLAWNPMVLQSIPMTAHVDAIVLTLIAGAILAHRHGRRLVAFLLLVGCFLIKLYLGPLAALYGLWLAARAPAGRRLTTFAGLGALGVAVTVLVYLPYADAGLSGLTANAISVGAEFSTGSPPHLLRWLIEFALSLTWLSDSAAATIGIGVARVASTVVIVGLLALAAHRLWRSPRRDPWPALAWYFLGYLLVTPWVFYWHEIPLLAIVAVIPWGLTSLVAVVASCSMLPQAAALREMRYAVRLPTWLKLATTLGGFMVYYGTPFAVAWHGWRNGVARAGRAAPPAPPARPALPSPEPIGAGTRADNGSSMNGGGSRAAAG